MSVVVARWEEDASWTNALDPSRFDVALYSRYGSSLAEPTSRYYVPHNFGDEAAIYLHYILLHYDTANFSEYTAFVDGDSMSSSMVQHTGMDGVEEGVELTTFDKLIHLNYGIYTPFMSLNWRPFQCQTRQDDDDVDVANAFEVWWHDTFLEFSTPILPFQSAEDLEWPTTIAEREESRRQQEELSKIKPIPSERVRPKMKRVHTKNVSSSTNTGAGGASTLLSRKARLFSTSLGRQRCGHTSGQHVVHRDRILSQPKSLYQATYDQLWNVPPHYAPLEQAWHLLFGELPQETKLHKCEYIACSDITNK